MKDLFFDYGELLFAYRFNKDTLDRADNLMLPQLARFKTGLTKDNLTSAHNKAIKEYLKARSFDGQEWPMNKIMALFLTEMGIEDEEAVRLAVETYKLYDHDEFPMDGITELVPELARKHSLHIISNLPHDSPLTTLENHGLLQHFTTTTFSYEAGYRKPRPEIYRLALQRAQCSPERGFFISHDQEEVDGAIGVGMQAHLATNAQQIRKAIYENTLL